MAFLSMSRATHSFEWHPCRIRLNYDICLSHVRNSRNKPMNRRPMKAYIFALLALLTAQAAKGGAPAENDFPAMLDELQKEPTP